MSGCKESLLLFIKCTLVLAPNHVQCSASKTWEMKLPFIGSLIAILPFGHIRIALNRYFISLTLPNVTMQGKASSRDSGEKKVGKATHCSATHTDQQYEAEM